MMARVLRFAAACVATTLAVGCASIKSYSVRAAENSCDGLLICRIYGPMGEYESPCTAYARDTIYPGDARWPYSTPGVCDAVVDGQVVSTRMLGAASLAPSQDPPIRD